MNIPWTKCSERMPPNNDYYIIINIKPRSRKIRGSVFHLFYGRKNDKLSWTPYTEETWKALNK